ncbi:hypothetical protein DACRYDRAFT_78686 [Dacryopinax primogenitus]|uniref:25S rRNA (uridine-N(3))-methyltransferase BMT5-like domain-containing protein n=1 Tax=Dacryopinax primogenitus (strain DJM 731) TaxID=1858805 RepID=M5GDZ4_DACPD|nr:uncharacterized protein DACRYDRAFT_78686 [Dacryopinax primogenitus]EJU02833.1 hypothetical protein DACRYDRAFT_78686 [Dacryopinax primogenitus]
MGKSNKSKGGLRSALVSLQSRVHAADKAASAQHVQEKKDQADQRQRSGKKHTSQGGQSAPVPFVSPWDNTLLIGEGNFSFSLSLVQHHGIPGYRITATSYDTEEQLTQKYPEAHENLRLLRENGVTVFLHVDARTLHKCKTLVNISKRSGGFSRVVWNFPHTGAGIQDQDRNVRVNQQAIIGFLRSVAPLLSSGRSMTSTSEALSDDAQDSDVEVENLTKRVDSRGRVLITLRNSVPYTLWEVSQLAKHPPPDHPAYVKIRSYGFQPSAYPGYEHRRTIGGTIHRPTSGDHEVPQSSAPDNNNRVSECRTWEFALRE